MLGNTATDENLESDSEDKNLIHCWKCGKKSLFEANFCMVCGFSLFEVGTESQAVDVKIPSGRPKNQIKTRGLKIPIMIGVPVLILIILGVGYNQGSFDNVLERPIIEEIMEEEIIEEPAETVVKTSKTQCGPGTIFDEDTYSCILEK